MQLKTPSNKHKLNFTTIWIENWCLHPIGLHNFYRGPLKEPCKFDPKPQKLEYKKGRQTVFSTGAELRKHLYLSLTQLATLSVFKQQLKRLTYKVETAGPVVTTVTVTTTMCVKAPDYRKDMLVRAKLQFESFDNATQPQKPHWESLGTVFAFPCEYKIHGRNIRE